MSLQPELISSEARNYVDIMPSIFGKVACGDVQLFGLANCACQMAA